MNRMQKIGQTDKPKPIIPIVKVGHKIQHYNFSTIGNINDVFQVNNLVFPSHLGARVVHLDFNFKKLQSLDECTQDNDQNRLIFNLGWTEEITNPRTISPLILAGGREYSLEAIWNVSQEEEKIELKVFIFSEPAPEAGKQLA